jgi:uncharacterized protein YneF (UPF0154 family)
MVDNNDDGGDDEIDGGDSMGGERGIEGRDNGMLVLMSGMIFVVLIGIIHGIYIRIKGIDVTLKRNHNINNGISSSFLQQQQQLQRGNSTSSGNGNLNNGSMEMTSNERILLNVSTNDASQVRL